MKDVTFRVWRLQAATSTDIIKRIEYHILRRKWIHMYVDMLQPSVRSLGATDSEDPREYVDIVLGLDSAESIIGAAIAFREFIRQQKIEDVKIVLPPVSITSFKNASLTEILRIANELDLH